MATQVTINIALSASSCVDALLAASAKASSNSCAAAAVPRTTIICRDGFFNSVSEPKYEPKSFGSADTSRNPRDSIPLDALPAFAARISASIAAELDREWIEQEDHVLVGNEAARLYLQSRNDPAESTDIGMILDRYISIAFHARCECDEITDDAIVLNIGVKIGVKTTADTYVRGQGDEG